MSNLIIESIGNGIDRLAQLADNPTIDYQQVAIYGSWLLTTFEVYLYKQQLKQYDIKVIPTELVEHLPRETFDKSQAYGRDKTRYSLIKKVFDQILSVLLIQFGLFTKMWDWSGVCITKLGLSDDRIITRSLIWTIIYVAISTPIGIPWDYFYTFVLEEKHGFNKSTVKLWWIDKAKTMALMAVLGLPIWGAFLWIINWAGKDFVPWLMLFMIVIQLSMQIIYPIFIQPLFNKLTPLPDGEVRTRVEVLANKLGFPLKHLYEIDGSKRSSHSNAYFYGLPWNKHIVIFDTLMEQSTPAEVEAVLGHELGHWYLSHPSKLLLIGNLHLLFTLTLFAVFIHNTTLYKSFGFDPSLALDGPRGPPANVIGFTLFQLLLEPLDAPVKFLFNSITRKYEYQADEFGVKLDKRQELKTALTKLHVKNLSSPYNDALYSMYHHSHPTLTERLRALDEYKDDGKPLKIKSEKKEL
ncbi:peptidase family M48-domain-containing protein [Naematelia encephala]|uniref:CAAX prenyl protease n=1 Tax=Naematelia encephala TaxID=71784 RepID=A0A1Y2AML5_9TREE|nr:peptidase family M48-domain-containing protein [Naematelia encephala]